MVHYVIVLDGEEGTGGHRENLWNPESQQNVQWNDFDGWTFLLLCNKTCGSLVDSLIGEPCVMVWWDWEGSEKQLRNLW